MGSLCKLQPISVMCGMNLPNRVALKIRKRFYK